MGITLKELQTRLLGELDVIPSASLKDRINDALRDIYDETEWGFLFTDTYIRTPAIIEGTATVVQFAETILLSASMKALVDALSINDVPLGERQIRIVGPVQTDRGFTYDILDYNSTTGTITISPPYQDESKIGKQIQILKIYYNPPYYQTTFMGVDAEDNPMVIYSDPIVDFKRFEYIISPQFNRRLILDVTPQQLHQFDPYREFALASEPRYLISATSKNGATRYELYPPPRNERVLRVKYLRMGQPLSNLSDEAPDMFSKNLIINKAKAKSYEWAIANADKLKLKSVGRFANLIALAEREYDRLLEGIKKKDEEDYPKAYQGNVGVPYYDYYWNNLDGECMGETLLLNF